MIAHFALWLVGGISLMWSLMPRAEVTAGFFRIQMLIALGLSVLGCVSWSVPAEAAVPGIIVRSGGLIMGLIAGISFCGSISWTLGARRAGGAICILIAIASTFLLIAVAYNRFASSLPSILADLTSAWILGSVLTGMLLGHWYLTAPAMSIEPLWRLNLYVLLASILRLAASGFEYWSHGPLIVSQTHLMWLTLRWLSGIIGPLVVSVMVFRILKYRNTQSATGVLFVGVIVSFIGEMSGALLAKELGVPF